MRILVTGGAGFLGSHLVDALVARGDEIVVLDDLSRGDKSQINHEHYSFKVMYAYFQIGRKRVMDSTPKLFITWLQSTVHADSTKKQIWLLMSMLTVQECH